MKSSIKLFVFLIAAGLLLFVPNVFAADGDLYVNGKVGIGTTSPAGSLDVNGSICIKGNCVNSIGGCIKTIKVQTFTSSGTYTPSAGMVYATVEVLGSGGGGVASGSGQAYTPGGGGCAGGYQKQTLSAAQIGSSQIVTVALGGHGQTYGLSDGTAGGPSSFGTLVSAAGGSFGPFGNIPGQGAPGTWPGGVGNSPAGGYNMVSAYFGGVGGSTLYGAGGYDFVWTGNGTAGGYGAGGGGAQYGTYNGGPGGPGLVIVTEYCTQ